MNARLFLKDNMHSLELENENFFFFFCRSDQTDLEVTFRRSKKTQPQNKL